LSDEEIQEIFDDLDKSKNLMLSAEEFARAIMLVCMPDQAEIPEESKNE
jgi:Ca2+-binding EF-hand superfamily protein